MKPIIITLVGVILATSTQLPSTKIVDSWDVTTSEHFTKIQPIKSKSKKKLKKYPVKCSDAIKKYSWNQTVAYNVMMTESKNYAKNLNDTPSTGDYSVGCFQINLMGDNQIAKYNLAVTLGYKGKNKRHELKEWLWDANNNVAIAYKMWQGQGWNPWSFTTCKKVACY